MSKTPTEIRLYGLVSDSIVDGPGFRLSVFTQGCPHHCEGCHNPESHDPEKGTMWKLEDIEAKLSGNPLLDGITISGGEPFAQPAACAELARYAHQKGLNVWTYSGYLYENLLALAQKDEAIAALLNETDVLVDGPFVLAQRSLDLLYKGSKNQRLIDVKQTKVSNQIVLYSPPEW
ncbi:MAG: anaerobic ribonucleoside-triphosphate reductase activating protein [Eubacteriales bacterium]|nr:anaerobic ribonucleoside-triphosphate reductase activating protein [Eubacteriales bacterium]